MYEWSLRLLLCRFGISVARNMDGQLCKRITLEGMKGTHAKAHRELTGMETLEWPAESRDLKSNRGSLGRCR